MTDSGNVGAEPSATTQTETWKPIPGFSAYEACDRGAVRSIDRLAGDRQLRGVALKTRIAGTSPYPLVNVTDDQGVRQTRTVHSLVLLAFAGPCPPGQETRHFNDVPTDNRWPENLGYGTKKENAEDKFRNGAPRAAPKPERHCVRCGAVLTTNGRRCHGCVAAIGQEAAELLRDGMRLEDAAAQLGYPSAEGLHALAVKHGGYGQRPEPWLRRASRRIRSLFVSLRRVTTDHDHPPM